MEKKIYLVNLFVIRHVKVLLSTFSKFKEDLICLIFNYHIKNRENEACLISVNHL